MRSVPDSELCQLVDFVRQYGRKEAAVRLGLKGHTLNYRWKLAEKRKLIPQALGKPSKAVKVATSDLIGADDLPQPLAEHKHRMRPYRKPKEADEQAAQLWAQFIATNYKDKNLRQKLADHYLFLVDNVVLMLKRSLPHWIDPLDLRGPATAGLIDATTRFSLDRGCTFAAFAYPRIRGAVLDMIRHEDTLSRNTRKRQGSVEKIRRELEQKLGHTPTDEELADEVPDLELFSFRESVQATTAKSLDYALPFDTDSGRKLTVIETLAAQGPSPGARLHKRQLLQSLLRGLGPDEFTLIYLYYYKNQTMKIIGQVLDLSESRISQLHTVLLEQLRSCRSLEDVEDLI
jgi:RNA polymerase sigma factor FliA